MAFRSPGGVGQGLGSLLRSAVLCLRPGVHPAEASQVLILREVPAAPAVLTFWIEAPWDSWDSFLGPRMRVVASLAKNSSNLSGFSQDPAKSQEVAVMRGKKSREDDSGNGAPSPSCRIAVRVEKREPQAS